MSPINNSVWFEFGNVFSSKQICLLYSYQPRSFYFISLSSYSFLILLMLQIWFHKNCIGYFWTHFWIQNTLKLIKTPWKIYWCSENKNIKFHQSTEAQMAVGLAWDQKVPNSNPNGIFHIVKGGDIWKTKVNNELRTFKILPKTFKFCKYKIL